MNAKTLAIALFSFVLGILLMRGLDALEPEPTNNDTVLTKEIEQRDKEIKYLKSSNAKLTILASKENDTVEIIKKEYVTIYKEVDRANRDDLNRAFDTLLTD